MVKGVSRQVIVVNASDRQIFEQAIFILKDGQHTFSNDDLLKEAHHLLRSPLNRKKDLHWLYRLLWSCVGAISIGIVWLLTVVL